MQTLHQSHDRHRLPGPAEDAWPHHDAETTQQKESAEQADKLHSRTISKDRVPAEHVIGAVKRFKIVSDRYRNRRKRFGLRFTLIAAAYNKDLMP